MYALPTPSRFEAKKRGKGPPDCRNTTRSFPALATCDRRVRALVSRIRGRSDLNEGAAMGLANEELNAVRAERGPRAAIRVVLDDDYLVALARATLVDALVTGDRDLLELQDIGADVEQQVRLIAARGAGDLAQLRSEVDRGLRTRRFLDYGESAGWARAAQPIVAELEQAVEASPSRELVELLQRALGQVVKVIMHADDSDGLIGDLARELLAPHARACDAGGADPVELAAWMVRFGFDDQHFFDVDPVRYASALGDAGLAAYRDAVDARRDGDPFAGRHAARAARDP